MTARILLALLVTSIVSPLWATTMYVDDTLLVPLRSGAGTSFRIVHKGIKSGTKLEILERNKVTGYSQVRTPSGLEGFLPSRYLSAEPVAKMKLKSALQQTQAFKTENAKLKTKLAKLQKEFSGLSANYSSTSKELKNNNKELSNIKSISSNALNLDRRNRELRESNEQLRNELELLQVENIRLKDKSESNMMLIGGGLVTLGIIIALLLPMIKPSKKSESWA
mgnify:FL=1